MILRITALALLISVAAMPQASAQQKFNYLSQIIDIPELVPPPPPEGSEAFKQDLHEVIEIQERRTEAQVKRGLADNVLTVYSVGDVLGPKFKKENLPITDAFLEKINADQRTVLIAAKNTLQRPRPANASKDVVALGGAPRLPTGYPSGGVVLTTLTSIVVAKMLPEKRFELFERNRDFAFNRVVIGQHFPRDVRYGEAAGMVIAHQMMESPAFQKDFEAARAELRQVMGYPAEPEVVGTVKK
jgi:acid phosphatase (class A)